MAATKRKRNSSDLADTAVIDKNGNLDLDIQPRKRRNIKTRSSTRSTNAAAKIKQEEEAVERVLSGKESSIQDSIRNDSADSGRTTRRSTPRRSSNMQKKTQMSQRSTKNYVIADEVINANTHHSKVTPVDSNKRKLPPIRRPPPPPQSKPSKLSSSIVQANKIPESPDNGSLESSEKGHNDMHQCGSTKEHSNMIEIKERNEEHGDGLEEETIVINNILSSSSSKNRNTQSFRVGSLFKTFLLCATSIAIVLIPMYDQHVKILKEAEISANTLISQKRYEIEEMKLAYSKIDEEIKTTLQSLNISQSREKECAQTNEKMQQKINSLTNESNILYTQLEESKVKITTMAGSEEDVRYSLTKSWEEISSLQQDVQHLHELNTDCDHAAKLVLEEKDNIENRMIELEFSLVEADDKFKLLQKSYSEEVASRQSVEMELQQGKKMIDSLKNQLDKEDGRAWYYQMHIQHLEGMIDEQETSLLNLKDLNKKLIEEKDALNKSLNSQVNEAVHALNAVAKSATVRKAQEFKEREHIVQIEKNQILNEAANAVQSVVSARKRMTARTIE